MDPIDSMLLRHAGKVLITLYPNPLAFSVTFSAPPSDSALAPMLQLVDSKRFEFLSSTKYAMENSVCLSYDIMCTNVIPRAEAIQALVETWGGGYTVSLVSKSISGRVEVVECY